MHLKKFFVGMIILFTFIGCNNEKEKNQIPNNKISENPKEFTIFAIHLGKAFDGELPVYQKAYEMTNVKLKGIASKNQSDEVLAFNLMISAGELPDIIAYEHPEELEKLGADKKVIPLEELVEKYAPNIKKFWEENPNYKKDAIAVDGHVYMIPNYNDYDSISTSQGYYIRKDWLKKLGLKEPKNVEELYKVLKSFRESDPNENGIKDEIPLFLRGNTSKKIITSLVDIFKAEYTWYNKVGSGPVFGPSQEEYKEAIRELAKWYKEGLIDPEVFTRDTSSRDYILHNNFGGFTCDWFSSTGSYNSKLQKIIPGFDFSIILPVEHRGKRTTTFARENYLGGWSISSTSKDPISIIKYFDFWYSEEGRRLWNFGIEGDTYTLVDGKPKFTDKVLKDPNGVLPLAILREEGAQYRLGMHQDGENERQWAAPEAVEAIDLYIKAGVVELPMPILKYTKEEMEELSRIDVQLYAIAEEMTQKWILGVSDVDKDWNNYIHKLNSVGLKKAEKIQKQAYKRFMKK
ncbi:extracellular solute-binding protein [Fusobacterium sp.]|uniref:extracellular solute-binding protein n=1 Tax=Fusobacterium sp. TaxID=68766 RepID=UPI002639B4A2|nr:extracellular solute-binding protein [Fusobacterium sp.]